MRLSFSIVPLLFTALFSHAAPQQNAAIPASIEGAVVRLATTEAVVGAKVELNRVGAAAATQSVVTPESGGFSFKDLEPGAYRLVATRPGGMYTPGEYGQRDARGRGMTFTLAAGQQMRGVTLSMIPTGSISGRVIDEDDDPVGMARVMALEAFYKEGRRTLNIVQAVRTNDLGEYRLFWLPPGRYYIAVISDDPRNPTFSTYINGPERRAVREDASPPIVSRRSSNDGKVVEEASVLVYYGGGVDAQRAKPIDPTPAASITAIDIPLGDAKVSARRIRGVVVSGANGQPAARAAVRLVPLTPAPHIFIPNGTTDESGKFEIAGAVPGPYLLFATVGASFLGTSTGSILDINDGMSGQVPIQVGNRDLENVAVTVRPAFGVAIRQMVDGIVRPFPVKLIRDPDILGMPSAGPAGAPPPAEGEFVLGGIGPGDYRLNLPPLPLNFYLKEARLGTIDVLAQGLRLEDPPESPIEMTFGSDGGALEGSVTDDVSQLVANAIVALVPDAHLRGRPDLYKSAATDNMGRFQLQGIAPGGYKIFAWEFAETDAWQNPDFIRIYEGQGEPVRIEEGSKQTLRIRVRQ